MLNAVVRASRAPSLFGPGRVADTLRGRFEVTVLFGALALIRLRADPGAAPLAQAFTDKLFRWLDAGLREAGVGDLSVAKKMRALAGDFYGRLEAYEAAHPDMGALAAAIGRNVLGDEGAPYAQSLANGFSELASRQSGAPVAALLTEAGWRLSPP